MAPPTLPPTSSRGPTLEAMRGHFRYGISSGIAVKLQAERWKLTQQGTSKMVGLTCRRLSLKLVADMGCNAVSSARALGILLLDNSLLMGCLLRAWCLHQGANRNWAQMAHNLKVIFQKNKLTNLGLMSRILGPTALPRDWNFFRLQVRNLKSLLLSYLAMLLMNAQNIG